MYIVVILRFSCAATGIRHAPAVVRPDRAARVPGDGGRPREQHAHRRGRARARRRHRHLRREHVALLAAGGEGQRSRDGGRAAARAPLPLEVTLSLHRAARALRRAHEGQVRQVARGVQRGGRGELRGARERFVPAQVARQVVQIVDYHKVSLQIQIQIARAGKSRHSL